MHLAINDAKPCEQRATSFPVSTLWPPVISYYRTAFNMDFKALMSAEISKSQPPSSTASTPQTKYLKRADLEAQRREAYEQEQRAIRADKESKARQKRKHEEEEAERNREREEKRRRLAEESRRRREEEDEKQERARRKRLGLPDLPSNTDGSKEGTPLADGEEDVPGDELVLKLRAVGEPTRLFGESHRQTLRRYRRLMERAAAPQAAAQTTGPIPTTLVLVPEAEMKVAGTVPADAEGRRFLFRQLASYFTMVLTEWGVALAGRPESVKGSFQGKAAYNAMVQSRENMRPLFKKFEKGELEDGILGPVVEIVRAAQERRYVDANDGYLTLSIGKA